MPIADSPYKQCPLNGAEARTAGGCTCAVSEKDPSTCWWWTEYVVGNGDFNRDEFAAQVAAASDDIEHDDDITAAVTRAYWGWLDGFHP